MIVSYLVTTCTCSQAVSIRQCSACFQLTYGDQSKIPSVESKSYMAVQHCSVNEDWQSQIATLSLLQEDHSSILKDLPTVTPLYPRLVLVKAIDMLCKTIITHTFLGHSLAMALFRTLL